MQQQETWRLCYAFSEKGHAFIPCQGESEGVRALAAIEEKAGKRVLWATLLREVVTIEVTEYPLRGKSPVDLM